MDKKYKQFVIAMTEREFKTRYKRTYLGVLWVIINPILQMIVIGSIFSYFIKIPDYFAFLLSGLLPWNFFTGTLNRGIPAFVAERLLIKKARFPQEAILLAILFSNFINLIAAFVVFSLFLFIFRSGIYHLTLIPVVLLWILALTGGILFLTATLQVRFRDVNFLAQAFLMILFYASPVLYDLNVVPVKLEPFFYLNPFTSVLGLFHCIWTTNCVLNTGMIGANLAVTFLIIAAGLIVFIKNRNFLVDWL